MTETSPGPRDGLSLTPLRALRPRVPADRLGRMLCPPYDVIDAADRRRLLDADPDNAAAVILPEESEAGYAQAAQRLSAWIDDGTYAIDETPTLFVYEMREPNGGSTTRGLLGAVQLRAPEDGVILPHENTMAGPVADRLAVMTATGTDLEPIYLVYDGGGPASQAVRAVDDRTPVAEAVTPDGLTHRLWAITDAEQLDDIADDLATRRALIADGHHRYATYRERQRLRSAQDGAGAWDRGLALLVDSSDYGPQVHPIHRVVHGLAFDDAVAALDGRADVHLVQDGPDEALGALGDAPGLAAVLTDGTRTAIVRDAAGSLSELAHRDGQEPALADLDVTVVHRGLVERVWNLIDDVETVGYAHDVADAVRDAQAANGVALLLRATPVGAVTAVAAAGARMPRKSTLFTPKPASGLVMRRLADQP